MKILFVSPSLPVPLTSGGAIRVFNLIRHLSRTDEVHFIGLDDGSTPDSELALLRAYCARLHIVTPNRLPRLKESVRVAGNVIRGVPFYTKYVDRPEFRRRLSEVTRMTAYDIIHVEHSHMAGLADAIYRHPGSRLVLSSENVASEQFYRMYRQESQWVEKLKLLLTWYPMKRWETTAAEAFDHVLTVTERDRALYQSLNPKLTISVVSNGVDTERFRPASREGREQSLLMVGSLDYAPNVDAVQFFQRDVFPLIRRELPRCRLTVVGKNPPPSILRSHGVDGVEVCPDVPDVRPYYEKAMLAPVALRSGGGSRLKVLEALALGTPVISTAIGFEGLNVQPDRDILRAETPAEFVRHSVEVMRNANLWNELSARGRALVEASYDWKHICAGLRETYQTCLALPAQRKETP